MPGEGPESGKSWSSGVTKPLSGGGRSRPPKELRLPTPGMVKPKPHTRRRQWVVYQHKLFRTMTFNAVPFEAPSQDFIEEGSTEIWEYINPNHDAHPMHVHLVNFQVLDRQPSMRPLTRPITTNGFTVAANRSGRPAGAGDHFTGPPVPPDPDEARSSKDTFKSYPETVTRIIIQEFTPPTATIASIPGSGTKLPATYIHHCHILEHEDDDLMRPWTIVGHGGHGH